ncbi:aldehyde dehydrogenase-like protein 8 family, member A1 [Rhizoclosmatium globosum]|uniref:Aldehyde dehydrogenase-like protein 8 family, member A1 n=1 Tax=Rhizoclosmatium globosum TaxID=329046 RepID=A0A1Y2CRW7_9FUNG|nr:aldehyde dehydrogenase-like protein 8 family, member A1 [Rhizoclosmatium globosum]|eukprot:ORY49105.1 aldehyde dehydrogenase-like protein 8 family, member A1 [Rhizoclosmatium globosum]
MSSSPIQLHNFIGGRFVPPSNDKYFESPNPSDGSTNALVPDSTDSDVDAAVSAAATAFEAWRNTSREARSKILLKIADLLERRIDEFAEAESRDQGKPVSLARMVDIPRAVHNFRFFASAVLHMTEKSTEMDGVSINYVQKYPVGVAALISPWNLPLYLATWKLAPAIASGCTSVLKPSEFTSVTCYLLCDILNQAGLPHGVVNMVFGTGPSAGAPLVSHPKVRLISFTGGTVTGQHIARTAAPLFKKLSLELGGKNANVIFADAEYEKCLATTINSSFRNQGEICLCGSRIFVERSLYPKFLADLKARTEALVVGHPSDPATQIGALISKQHLEKVMGYVALAQQEGGTIETGGTLVTNIQNGANGFYMRPTIITGLTHLSRCAQEEIFGPVVTVIPFDTEADVVEWTNSTQYGLSASVWTSDLKRAVRVSGQLEVGTVWVNQWMVRDLNLPFGGVKGSGVGREGAPYSWDFFCEERAVMLAL